MNDPRDRVARESMPAGRAGALSAAAGTKRLEEAFELHAAALSRYARFLGGVDEARAEDLVQSAFVALMNAARRGEWPPEPRGFLFQVLINQDRAHRRDAQRRSPDFWAGYARFIGERHGAPPPSPEARIALQEGIEALPEGQREVLFRLCAGLSYAEVAAALEIPEKTVRSRYYAALERLRRTA